MNRVSTLPIPHPLDYDWRFDEKTSRRLVADLHDRLPRPAKIALLGAPSLVEYAQEDPQFENVILCDSNRAVISSLASLKFRGIRLFPLDVSRERLPFSQVNAVVIDPPWYLPHFRSFLWAATSGCMVGGFIYVCMPPVGTRPGIQHELKEIEGWATKLGLELIGRDKAYFRFQTPPFEVNALRASNTKKANDWRTGDLVLFRKTSEKLPRRPPSPTTELGDWGEVIHSGVRVRFRSKTSGRFDNPALFSIVEGDVLPTVSRRDPRRKAADIWTSGNRIFGCRAPFLFGIIAAGVKKRQNLFKLVAAALNEQLPKHGKSQIVRTGKQVRSLIRLEGRELLRYFEKNEDTF